MSILTHKMKTAHFENSDNVVSCMFFDEGSGTIVSDAKTGRSVTPLAMTFTTPNAIEVNGNVDSSAALPVTSKNIIAIDVVMIAAAASVNDFRYGTATGERKIELAALAFISDADGTAGTSLSFQALTAGQICARCLTFNQSTGEMRIYSKVGSAAAQFDDTTDRSSAKGEVALSVKINLGGLAHPKYGVVLYGVNVLPDDTTLLSVIESVYAMWTVGHKYLPVELA